MKRRKHGKDLVLAAVILILALVMLYSGLQILESTVLPTAQKEQNAIVSKTITRDGVAFYPRKDITVMLVMGIDQSGPVEESESYVNRGATDLNVLLIFDEANEICNVLYLNRDTMLEMPVLGIGGRQAGTYYGQLALSHTYGSGLEDSCENTRKTISDLLYGITIDYYMAMNMDAIAILNDAVGGVTVTVTDDFSMVDPSITMGEVTLMGDQALSFVRSRQNVGDQLNLSRMERQQEYLNGFAESFRSRQADTEFVADTYNQVSPYIVSDCTVKELNRMIDRYSGYEIGQVVTPEGENTVGEEYMEFYVDEEALDSLILELFYAPKK